MNCIHGFADRRGLPNIRPSHWHRTLLVFGLLIGSANAAGQSTLADRVDGLVAPLVEAHQFMGAVVMTRHGEVVYQAGFGMANHEAGLEFSPDTPSDGGSLAKTFTAAGLQWLAHDGKIELDAPVTRYLRDYPHAETTVRQLISHSNGLPPYYEFFDPFFRPDEVRSTQAMLQVVSREAPVPRFVPGSRFEYSNFAFDLGALIIEQVSGLSYEEFLTERFFSALDMQSTFARPARLADWQGVRTKGYRWDGKAWEVVEVFDMEGFLGASNLYFSALDLSRWASANAAGTALPEAVSEQGQERALIAGRPSYINGLSWYCSEDNVRCYYTGDINAFHGFVYWDSERKETVSLLSNSSLAFWQVFTLQRQLVAALAEEEVNPERKPDFEILEDEDRALFTGTFTTADDQFEVQISNAGENLQIRMGSGLEFDAFQVGPDTLYVPGPDLVVAFSGGLPPTTVHLRSMFLDKTATRGGESH